MTSAAELRRRLARHGELALLDVREQGVHYRGHPFFASSAPLSRVEMLIADLVPRRGAPIVVFDAGEGLAGKAAARLAALGYPDVTVLDGGCAAWQAAGGELFSGINVPSKAFGELVEHRYATPRISAEELRELQASQADMVVLDSRPFEEYQRMCIPGGIDTPGAELAYRVHDLAPDPGTLVVVNCAGRTRSIIGCQSLRNAEIPNRVVALKDGTMGWELAGYGCERGAARRAPDPSPAGRAKAQALADQVARRHGVKFAGAGLVHRWLADPKRTTYLLDVRTREEFEAAHLAASRHAPGGQLVQATDEYMAVRHARVVLVDPERVRAIMTASWLGQLGWHDVYVLPTLAGLALERGARPPTVLGLRPWPTARHTEGVVLDFSTSLRFHHRHIPGAWWVVRSRLDEARRHIGEAKALTLTSEDGVLAQLAAPDVAALWPGATVRVLDGGNAGWAGAWESGTERATTTRDDVWYKPYDHVAGFEEHARDYLAWEVALIEQIKRDPTIRFGIPY
ncbi:MAG TPA: rhodanese-like domain-containing protein [Burkholderiales bacterium]|nr:rhodanese-like domain-containing protein [Burkholderiales bacterium]